MSAASSNGSGGTLFKAQLDGSTAALFAGKRSTAVPASSAPAVSATDALVRAVKEQLDRGTSLGDVIAKLAGSLATSVAAQLGISAQAAQQQLTQVFTQALQPSGTGPPGTNAERASALVSRLRQLAELATRVTNGDTGQSIRLIAGQRSDAEQAKANPAPEPDRILRDALAALAAPASPVTEATALAAAVPAAASPAATAAQGDGRTAALQAPAEAIATGGDTPLGRIMARALQLDAQRPAPAAAPHPLAGPVQAAGDGPPGVPAPVAAAGTAANPAVLDAFVQAFASALARSEASGSSAGRGPDTPSSAPANDAAPVSAISSQPQPQPAPSLAIPFVSDAAPAVPPAPAPMLPQTPHVDANAVVDQILRGMAIRTTDGQSEVRLRLVPENLGDVSVKLIVSGGSVDASITAHTADAQNALAGGATQLAKSLADAGLKLQSFTVGLAGGGFADPRDQSRSHDAWGRPQARRIGGVAEAGTDAPDENALLAVPSFGPPIYAANRALGALNYLV